jgi:5,10-methylenetetrahydrofolate reductase
MNRAAPSGSSLLEALKGARDFCSAELRPPQAGREGAASIEDWIDTYHSIRRMTLARRHVFITDNAVGRLEEENLRHLVANLGPDAERERIVPFLTSKHSLDYCLRYAERASAQGFRTLVVLGGDRHDGIPRCVEHAFELRRMIREHVPGIVLGGWANPHRDPDEQARFLASAANNADFFLTQVVSHHSAASVARFLEVLDESGVALPAIFGVFYYRSARRKTLEALQHFFPVPIDELEREFVEEKLDPDAVCARSIVELRRLGARSLYVSNLPIADAAPRLERIVRLSTDGAR